MALRRKGVNRYEYVTYTAEKVLIIIKCVV